MENHSNTIIRNSLLLKCEYHDSYQSQTRNKLIAEAFYLTKDIEKYGSGFIRIRREIKQYPTMLFEYRELGDGFLVEIKYEKQKLSTRAEADVVDSVVDNVVDNEVLILKMLRKKNDTSAKELSNYLGISSRTVQRVIRSMIEKEIIKRIGPAKGGHWEIFEK